MWYNHATHKNFLIGKNQNKEYNADYFICNQDDDGSDYTTYHYYDDGFVGSPSPSPLLSSSPLRRLKVIYLLTFSTCLFELSLQIFF